MKKLSLCLVLLSTLAGCGGGGGNAGTCVGSYAVCYPESVSNNQSNVDAEGNLCTVAAEKTFVRRHLDDVYLWYKEIIDVPSGNYSSAQAYFDALLVKSRDRFSFTAPQAEIDGFFSSGEEVGYGLNYTEQNGRTRIAYSEPGSPAELQGITRGAEIIAINGTPVASMTREAKNAALYPNSNNATNRFDILDRGNSQSRSLTLSASKITKSPVLKAQVLTDANQRKFAYVQFNDHIATAEAGMINAFNLFQSAGVDELVLDLRYNGGGFLYIASEVASMIGGAKVSGKVFEQLKFNDKHDDWSNDPNSKLNFLTVGRNNQPLPQLGLRRVFVLTGPNTCSASESIINGLSPFVEVITLGGTTCGKPYGFNQKNYCGTAYFAIEFSGVNHLGQGDYADGIATRCNLADDLEHDLGDRNERLLAAALSYATTGSCPASALGQARQARLQQQSLPARPWRQQKVLR